MNELENTIYYSLGIGGWFIVFLWLKDHIKITWKN